MLLLSSSGTGRATGLRNGSSGVRFPTQARDILDTESPFSEVKRPWSEVDHLPIFSDEVKNECSEISASSHPFMTSTETTLPLPLPLLFFFN